MPPGGTEMTEIQEAYMDCFDEWKLFYRKYVPEKIRAVVLLLHGICEHSGRYLHVMSYLLLQGCVVCAPDYRGHGKSARIKGDVEGFDKIKTDIKYLTDILKKQYSDVPIFILGHSMGGIIALQQVLEFQNDYRGMLLSGASIILPDTVSPVLMAFAPFIAKLFPLLPVQEFDFSVITRDKEILQKSAKDPLNYRGKIRARTGYELLQAVRSCRASLAKISLPVLIMHGGDDRNVPVSSATYIYEHVSSQDKTIRIFPGLYHEIMNEPERQEVLRIMAEWIEKRI